MEFLYINLHDGVDLSVVHRLKIHGVAGNGKDFNVSLIIKTKIKMTGKDHLMEASLSVIKESDDNTSCNLLFV